MSMETDRIEADLNESRHRLNDTLEALGQKLSPGQMVDEVLGLAQGQAGQLASKLGAQVRDNPMPALLIAAGVGMLLLNRNSGGHHVNPDDWHHERRYRSLEEARWSTPRNPNESDSDYDHRIHLAYAEALDLKQAAGEAVHEFKQRIGAAVQEVKHAASGARERLSHALSGAAHAASGAAHAIGDKAHRLGEKAVDARHNAENFYQDTPLAAGAIAVAIGALIGSATPLSQPEREGLRGVAGKAARTGADLAERGARIVEDSVERPLH